jgi:glycosyltransferase involved in cell wall biosynthesis
VVEAMMFALPVVATRWRGIPDIVDESTTGQLVPPRDPKATADQLRTLIRDRDLRQRMGRAGRARYLEQYRLERFLENMHDVLYAESLP